MFKKLNITVDAYEDKRSKILTIDYRIPNSFGNNVNFKNIGKMTSKGIESNITFTDKTGRLKTLKDDAWFIYTYCDGQKKIKEIATTYL